MSGEPVDIRLGDAELWKGKNTLEEGKARESVRRIKRDAWYFAKWFTVRRREK